MTVETVHLIFKTHLDLGFTDYARSVVKRYFETFIPRAIETARQLRGRPERFIWTTGSWLIYEYLEQAGTAKRKQMEAAIEAGDLVWHGLPFTTHSELMDASLFRFGLSLSQRLDQRFGKQTIAAKMTDVPGHTRAIVPLLAEAGIRLLHLGANPASTPPAVPPVFVWRDPSGAQVMVVYQKGAYGDATIVSGLADALAFAHTNDNLGPQTPEQVRRAYADLRARFPQAHVAASTLDAFAQKLANVESQLPVVTQELGDTWIHGIGTDPYKVSQFKELSRLRRHWLESGKVSADDPHLDAFSRQLMLIPEHTWGMDEKTHLADCTHYGIDDLQAARRSETFKRFEASWLEQRAYVAEAVAALGDSPLAHEATQHLRALEPTRPELLGTRHDLSVQNISGFQLKFDPQCGAITHLTDRRTGRRWASPKRPLTLFRYQTFSQADYDRFYRQYIINKRKTAHWSLDDYTKPGMEAAGQPSGLWTLALSGISRSDNRILVDLVPRQKVAWGCPRRVTLELTFPEDEPALHLTLQWFDKPASRLPEAMWLSFNPLLARARAWRMRKMGAEISPLEVIRDGSRKLHAVESVHYDDGHTHLSIESPDAPLLAPGEPALLNFNRRQPPLRRGMHFNLYNNLWGTNFPMWYDDDARFRFTLRL